MRRVTLALGIALALAACAAPPDDVADDSIAADSALVGAIAVGDELVTTSNVNLRGSPSTQGAIVRTLPKGSTVVARRASPDGAFYGVSVGADSGWVHGNYLQKKGGAAPAGGCVERRLRFSADELPAVPSDPAMVWGGNATGGELLLDPPYSADFLSRARTAHDRGLEVFAYLEGPCGNTGGVDDGESARCKRIHRAFNARYAPGTPDTDAARWKPYTMKQLRESGSLGVDYCEIDNLQNAVTIPLEPLLAEIKAEHDAGRIHCRIVLKNVSAVAIDGLRARLAPTPADARFIAPFHVYEADDLSEKPALDAAMRRLEGPGAVTIISTDTFHYGKAFTPDRFLTCR